MPNHVLGAMLDTPKFSDIYNVCTRIHRSGSILRPFLKQRPWMLSVRNRTIQETLVTGSGTA